MGQPKIPINMFTCYDIYNRKSINVTKPDIKYKIWFVTLSDTLSVIIDV
jgi:hypothetical protein